MMSRVIPFFVAKSTRRGAEQYVRLASDRELAGVTGTYLCPARRAGAAAPLSLDAGVQERIGALAAVWAAPFPSSSSDGAVEPRGMNA
jgi:hypothetical protein